MIPEMIILIDKGKMIVKKTRKREPVKILALLITSGFRFSKPDFADLKMNGDATKIWASTTAIILPGMVMPKTVNIGPSSPFGAKAKSNATPATAGGNTMGKSISVSMIDFPGNFLVTKKYAVGTVKRNEITVAMAEVYRLICIDSIISEFCSCAPTCAVSIPKKTASIGRTMNNR